MNSGTISSPFFDRLTRVLFSRPGTDQSAPYSLTQVINSVSDSRVDSHRLRTAIDRLDDEVFEARNAAIDLVNLDCDETPADLKAHLVAELVDVLYYVYQALDAIDVKRGEFYAASSIKWALADNIRPRLKDVEVSAIHHYLGSLRRKPLVPPTQGGR